MYVTDYKKSSVEQLMQPCVLSGRGVEYLANDWKLFLAYHGVMFSRLDSNS